MYLPACYYRQELYITQENHIRSIADFKYFTDRENTLKKPLFDKTKYQYDKVRIEPNGPNLFNV